MAEGRGEEGRRGGKEKGGGRGEEEGEEKGRKGKEGRERRNGSLGKRRRKEESRRENKIVCVLNKSDVHPHTPSHTHTPAMATELTDLNTTETQM